MGKMAKAVKENRKNAVNKQVLNFMGGVNYELDPLETLKMISASSIFGEPQYYRNGEFDGMKVADAYFGMDSLFAEYSILSYDKYKGKKTSEIMEMSIDEALDQDFGAVLEWAATLRHEYFMRLNPQIIMVRAAIHPKRADYTQKHPGKFHEINEKVMSRADDAINQITYFLYLNGNKAKIPGILKKSWAKKLSSLRRYEMAKYKNSGIGMIDAVRISHASGPIVGELMQTGTVKVEENQLTWENLRSNGKEWKDILETIRMPHMALLRNLRNILKEVTDEETIDWVLGMLKDGVQGGKQFPFRYLSAYRAVKEAKEDENGNAKKAKKALEDCIDIACSNLPVLKGHNAFLSDNSGSAHGTFTSEYGSVKVADIDNLSAVIGAVNSEDGVMVPFGDRMKIIEPNEKKGILKQADKMGKVGQSLGGGTEGGIWKFFYKALGFDSDGKQTKEKIKYDNICVFSDMQAGYGELYGEAHDKKVYKALGFNCKGGMINVAKLIEMYRKTVNPKVNVYLIQTAGYNNACIPGNSYRTTCLHGWTGKELVYMDAMNKFWDECDAKRNI